MSDAAFPLFLTASLSFPDPIRDLVRPRKTVRIREAFLLLMGKQPVPIGPDGEAGPGQSREIHRLYPHAAWEDRLGRHRQTSSVVRKPSERGEVIEIRGTEERRG